MVHKKLENFLKKVLPVHRYLHRKVCAGTSLHLDYSLNKDAIDILAEIFIHREYADYFPMQQSATVVDIGAHYGYFSFFAAMNLAPNAKIISIEPSPDNFKIFQKNLSANNFPNIHTFNLALADQSGERAFYGGKSFNHSFFSNSKQDSISTPTLSLKDFMQQQQLEQIDFLKLDCEGAEFPIILQAGAEELEKVKTISMEFHDLPKEGYTSLQLIHHLKKHGFEIVKYEHDSDYSFGNLSFGKIIGVR